MAKYVMRELCDGIEGNDKISTWLVETCSYVGERFYDEEGDAYDETEYVETFHMGDAAGNYPMERGGAQRTIPIPGQ
eukprot:9484529-Pyramimonas_sp.AAC.1